MGFTWSENILCVCMCVCVKCLLKETSRNITVLVTEVDSSQWAAATRGNLVVSVQG